MRWCTTQLNKSGAAMQPCRTPLVVWNHSESASLILIQLSASLYSFCSGVRIIMGVVSTLKIFQRAPWSAVSNTAFKFKNSMKSSLLNYLSDSWNLVNSRAAWHGIKLACWDRHRLQMATSALVSRIIAKSFAGIANKVIPLWLLHTSLSPLSFSSCAAFW